MAELIAPALRGEILAPGESMSITVASDPFGAMRGTIEVPVGASLAEIVEAAAGAYPLPATVSGVVVDVGGVRVPRDWWTRIRVRPGAIVVVRGVPADGLNDILRAVLTIALAVVTNGISNIFVAAAVTVGGLIAINALFPTRPAQLAEPNYRLGLPSNSASVFGAVPVVLGTMRVYPKRIAAYDEFVGGDQYLRILYLWGYGPLAISDLKLGETALSSFADVEVETVYGYYSDPALTLYPAQVLETALSVELTAAAGWQTRTTPENVEEITLDVTAPGGIYRSASGKMKSYTVSLRAEYRPVGAPSWNVLGVADLTARATDEIRYSFRKTGLSGQYDVRLTKTSTDYDGDDTVSEAVYWTALRGFRSGAPLNRPRGKALAATVLRIRATGQLNGTPDDLNGICTSLAAPADAPSDPAASTNNQADLALLVLRGAAHAAPVGDTGIDLAAFADFRAWCTAKGFAFNQYRDFQASVRSTLDDIAATARAIIIQRDGLWTPVWDDPDASIVDHYTPETVGNFRTVRVYRQMPHAFRVRFINQERGYAEDERIVYLDGYNATNATLFEGIEFPGVTDPALIHRHVAYHVAQLLLRPEQSTFNLDISYVAAGVGRRVRVAHPVPLWGLATGRVKAVDGDTVTLSEPVLMAAGKDYAIRFRLSDGSSLYRTVTTAEGRTAEIALSGDGDPPAAGDLFMFGEAGLETVVLRIADIKPGSKRTAVLTCYDDAPAIADADTGAVPPFDSKITLPVDRATLAPTSLTAEEEPYALGAGVLARVRLAWSLIAGSAAIAFEAEIRDDDGDRLWRPAGKVDAPATSLVIEDVPDGAVSYRVRATFASGNPSRWTELTGQTVEGLSRQPDDVADLRIAVIGDVATLSWAIRPSEAISHAVVRYAPGLSGAEWNSAAVVLDHVDATSVQVPNRAGSFLVKWVNLAGIESANAAVAISNVDGIANLNVVETVELAPTWSGTHDGTLVTDNALRLEGSTRFSEWGALADWPGFMVRPEGTFLWSDTLDLGEVYTSRVSFLPVVAGENIVNTIAGWSTLAGVDSLAGANASAWSLRCLERHTSDDPEGSPTWTDWREIQIGDIKARAFQFKLVLASFDTLVTPVVSAATITVDMPDSHRAGTDISIPEAGLHVDFDPPFREFAGMGITASVPNGVRVIVSNQDAEGFDVIARDAVDAAVSGTTFSYNAKGYGSRAAS